jgi:phosphatidylglycerophosphate synthase
MKLYGNVRDENLLFRIWGNWIADKLKNTFVSSLQVSYFRLLLLIPIYYLYLHITPINVFIASILYLISTLLDFVDGKLAIIKNQSTKLGIWIEDNLDSFLFLPEYLFGFIVSLGVYKQTNSQLIMLIFILNIIFIHCKKMIPKYNIYLNNPGIIIQREEPLKILIWWNVHFIIWVSILYYPLSFLPVNPIVLGFGCITLLSFLSLIKRGSDYYIFF